MGQNEILEFLKSSKDNKFSFTQIKTALNYSSESTLRKLLMKLAAKPWQFIKREKRGIRVTYQYNG